MKLAAGLAELHSLSRSPTGKFGFHVRTCHARIAQAVDFWDDSWCSVFTSHLGHVFELAKPILDWPHFDVVASLTLERVVPRLLLPLQAHGRVLKPSLVHGNVWDGNTAMDARTGEAFVFDVCSFYGHNEYDIGNWRAQRHRLSDKAYTRSYKRCYPVSEPGTVQRRSVLISLLSSAYTCNSGRLGRKKHSLLAGVQHWQRHIHSRIEPATTVSYSSSGRYVFCAEVVSVGSTMT